MKTILKTCLFCNGAFEADAKNHNKGKALFCSKSCVSKSNAKKAIKPHNSECALCSKTFYRSLSKLKNSKSGFVFCSKICKGKAQRLGSGFEAMLPPHYGTSEGLKNYRLKAMTKLEQKCVECGWNEYPQVLDVHHIDCNRSNNNLDNLQFLCPTCHQIKHWLTKTGRYANNLNK